MDKIKYKKETIEWLGSTILPFFLVLIIWPIYWVIFKKPFNFQRVLCSGDLFAICFTVLISAYAEFSFKQNALKDNAKISSEIELSKQYTIGLFVLSIAAYFVMKIATFNSDIPKDNNSEILFDLTVYAITSILFSLFIIFFILDKKLDLQDI